MPVAESPPLMTKHSHQPVCIIGMEPGALRPIAPDPRQPSLPFCITLSFETMFSFLDRDGILSTTFPFTNKISITERAYGGGIL